MATNGSTSLPIVIAPLSAAEIIDNVLTYYDTKVIEKDGTSRPMFDVYNHEKAEAIVKALRDNGYHV